MAPSRRRRPSNHPPPSLPPPQVVLAKPVPSLGAAGDLVTVPLGYARNYLKPNRLASPATAGVLAGIEKAAAAAAAAAAAEKERARAMATALATIGKFVVKKKAGEGDALFGTVTAADVCDAIFQQTGKQLDKRAVTLPDIKTVGAYDATVKLHADVVGAFKVIVQKEKNA